MATSVSAKATRRETDASLRPLSGGYSLRRFWPVNIRGAIGSHGRMRGSLALILWGTFAQLSPFLRPTCAPYPMGYSPPRGGAPPDGGVRAMAWAPSRYA